MREFKSSERQAGPSLRPRKGVYNIAFARHRPRNLWTADSTLCVCVTLRGENGLAGPPIVRYLSGRSKSVKSAAVAPLSRDHPEAPRSPRYDESVISYVLYYAHVVGAKYLGRE